jgi:hypothetical protein
METKNEYLEENTFEYLKKKTKETREKEIIKQDRKKVSVKFVPVP